VPLTGRKAGWARNRIRAEKTRRAARGYVQLARPPAPAAPTEQPWLTGLIRRTWNRYATSALLLCAWRNAVAHQGTAFPGRQRSASEAIRALRIRGTLAVRAVEPSVAGIAQAAQRWVAICRAEALAVVGLKAQAFLSREHRAETPTTYGLNSWTREEPTREGQDERYGEDEPAQDCQDHAPVHPHLSRQSSMSPPTGQ
jgi:hypothetical protein